MPVQVEWVVKIAGGEQQMGTEAVMELYKQSGLEVPKEIHDAVAMENEDYDEDCDE